jgi:hypothetical protein
MQLVEALRYKPEGRGIYIDLTFPAPPWTWVRLSLQQKWVPVVSPGV